MLHEHGKRHETALAVSGGTMTPRGNGTCRSSGVAFSCCRTKGVAWHPTLIPSAIPQPMFHRCRLLDEMWRILLCRVHADGNLDMSADADKGRLGGTRWEVSPECDARPGI
jgi:hypothetical protein